MHNLPSFNIQIDQISNNVSEVLAKSRSVIEQLLKSNEKPTWDNFFSKIEILENEEHKVIGVVSHLTSVKDSDELREQYDKIIPMMVEASGWFMQNKKIYDKFIQMRDGDEYPTLLQEQKRYIDKTIRNFELGGVNLSDDLKSYVLELRTLISDLSNQFGKNLLDSTNNWKKHITDISELDGLSQSDIDVYQDNAKKEGFDGYTIHLSNANYFPIMMYSKNRELRKELYQMKSTLASERCYNPKYDNSQIMKRLLETRTTLANVLGFGNHAELVLTDRMADSTQDVMDFLMNLKYQSRQFAENDYEELKAYVAEHHADEIDKLEPWDISYYVEKLSENKYQFNDEMLKVYFPIDSVINGLFKTVNQLYGLEFKPREVEVWNDQVKYYDVFDGDKLIAGFYFDLYARSDKHGGAWMNDAVYRVDINGDIQNPVAYLICNFMPSVDGKPSLLTHQDVLTLFHEFGHGLHHMLTKIKTLSVSGINGVEWDAVELPSQIMENWCWNKEVLQLLSSHYETGEKLPDDLYEKMIRAKNFRSGSIINRQTRMSLLDFMLHMKNEFTDTTVQEVTDELNATMYFGPKLDYDVSPNVFSHIFDGGYSAGYYSYSWAEVLSCDAFSKFEENGIFDHKTGQEFRTEILEKGGSRPAMESFVAFRGRKPNIDAYMKYNGLV